MLHRIGGLAGWRLDATLLGVSPLHYGAVVVSAGGTSEPLQHSRRYTTRSRTGY
jgi:hypothetical protein